MIKIYIFDDFKNLTAEKFDFFTQLTPKWRKDYADSFSLESDRQNAIIAYILLKFALQKDFNIIEPFEFQYNANGKPYFKQFENLHFSISHGKGLVACAIYEKPIGIDVESVNRFNLDTADKLLSAEDRKKVFSSKDPQNKFASIWTQKESAAKCAGGSITAFIKKQIDGEFLFNTVFYGNFAVSACIEKTSDGDDFTDGFKTVNLSIQDISSLKITPINND